MRVPVKDSGAYVKSVKADVVKNLQDANLKTNEPAAATRALAIASDVVEAFAAKQGNVSPQMTRELVASTLGAAADELRQTAELAATAGKAQTLARDVNEIMGDLDSTLARVNTKLFDDLKVPNASPKEMASALASLAPLAQVAGGPAGHDFLYALAAKDTALGPTDQTARQHAAAGELPIDTRRTQLPFAKLLALDEGLMLKALGDSGHGVQGVIDNLGQLDKLGGLTSGDPAKFKAEVAKLPERVETAPTYDTSPKVLATLERIEAELASLKEIGDRDHSANGDQILAALKTRPLAAQALLAAQVPWVRRDMGRETPRFSEYRHVLDLNGHTALRNLPIAVATIEGVKTAATVMNGIIDHGLDYSRNMPGEHAFYLQNMLEAAGRQAIEEKNPADGNRILSKAIAFESSLSLVATEGLRGTAARDVLPTVSGVIEKIAFEAGEQFYVPGGEKAGAASKVAMRHAGQLLAALHPDVKRSATQWQTYALGLFNRASLEDVDTVRRQTFGGGALPKNGETLRGLMAERFRDDAWFIGHVTGKDEKDPNVKVRQFPTAAEQKSAGKGSLDEKAGELKDLGALFFGLNAAWKVGQGPRGVTDRTRIDSMMRGGVYDNYLNLTQARGDDLDKLYVILKDGWEGLEKSEIVAQELKASSA